MVMRAELQRCGLVRGVKTYACTRQENFRDNSDGEGASSVSGHRLDERVTESRALAALPTGLRLLPRRRGWKFRR